MGASVGAERCRRPVAVTDGDRGVVEQRRALAVDALTDAGAPARQRLRHRQQPDRMAFVVIGFQQRRSRLAAHDGDQLPGQVVRVLDASVGPEAASRRDDVSGVADQEDASRPILLGHLSASRESQHLEVRPRDLGPDRDLHLRQTGRRADQRDDPLVGIVSGRPGRGRSPCRRPSAAHPGHAPSESSRAAAAGRRC